MNQWLAMTSSDKTRSSYKHLSITDTVCQMNEYQEKRKGSIQSRYPTLPSGLHSGASKNRKMGLIQPRQSS